MNKNKQNILMIIGAVVLFLIASWIGGLLEIHTLHHYWSAANGFADPYLYIEWNAPWFSFSIPL